MTKPKISIHNTETDEVIEREMNDDEFAAYKENLDRIKAEQVIAKTKETAKAELLTKLGITAEEAALLLS